jgi:hypothetical protein
MDQERAEIHTKFKGKAFEWERMTCEQLAKETIVLEEKAGTWISRIINKYGYYLVKGCIFVLIFIVFWFVVITLSSRVAELFPDRPNIRLIFVAITFGLCMSFPFWGMSEEKIENLWSPMNKWGNRVKEQQKAYDKLQAVRFYLRKKKNNPNFPSRK